MSVRRTAAPALLVLALALAACGTQGSTKAADTSDPVDTASGSPSPAPTAAEAAATPATTTPSGQPGDKLADVPIDAGMSKPARVSDSPRNDWLITLHVCDIQVWGWHEGEPGRWAASSGGDHGEQRALIPFQDARHATDLLAGIQEAARTCAGDGLTVLSTPLRHAYAYGTAAGGESTVTYVVRKGSDVLIDVTSDAGAGTTLTTKDLQAIADGRVAGLRTVAGAL